MQQFPTVTTFTAHDRRKCTDLKEELRRILHLKMACLIPPVLSLAGIITNYTKVSKLFNLRPTLYSLMQKAVTLNTCHTVRKVCGRIMSKKCLVSETELH